MCVSDMAWLLASMTQPAEDIHYNNFVWKTLPFCLRKGVLLTFHIHLTIEGINLSWQTTLHLFKFATLFLSLFFMQI